MTIGPRASCSETRRPPHYRNANHTGILRMAALEPLYNGYVPTALGQA